MTGHTPWHRIKHQRRGVERVKFNWSLMGEAIRNRDGWYVLDTITHRLPLPKKIQLWICDHYDSRLTGKR